MLPPVSHQCATHVEGRMQPLVKVEGKRVHPLDPRDQMPVFRRNREQRSDTAIDMQPEPFVTAQISNFGQRVDGTSVGGSGRGDHAGGAQTCLTVSSDRVTQRA